MGKLVNTNQHRGHHEGHFRLRKDGRWECQFTLPNGKRKSVYGKSRPDVRAKMEEVLGKAKKGIDLKGERQTLAHFLTTWMEETQQPKLRPSTIKSYQCYIRLHIVPALGDTTLGDLTAQDVQRFLNGRIEGGPLTAHCAVHPGDPPRRPRSGAALGLRRAQRRRAGLTAPAEAEADRDADRGRGGAPHGGNAG